MNETEFLIPCTLCQNPIQFWVEYPIIDHGIDTETFLNSDSVVAFHGKIYEISGDGELKIYFHPSEFTPNLENNCYGHFLFPNFGIKNGQTVIVCQNCKKKNTELEIQEALWHKVFATRENS